MVSSLYGLEGLGFRVGWVLPSPRTYNRGRLRALYTNLIDDYATVTEWGAVPKVGGIRSFSISSGALGLVFRSGIQGIGLGLGFRAWSLRLQVRESRYTDVDFAL